jgi:hypothetical protein
MKTTHVGARIALAGLLICLLMAGRSLPGGGRAAGAPEPWQETVTIYDGQADHLWNRLHRALFVRTTPAGKTLGHDEVDPLLWPRTRHLLTGRSHEDAGRLLDEFLTRDGDRLIRDPLKRAVLQHDLWTVFEWTAYPYGHFYGTQEHGAARQALQRRLVQAIHRLAAAPSVIASLPDSYRAAVKSGAFATSYDSEHPERPFLPDNLFAANGPWVCVGGPLDGPAPVALAHSSFFSGRSAFLVFVRLPGGRAETLAYLDKLNHLPTPWALRSRKPNEEHRQDLLELRRDLPELPVGSQLALVRQMVLPTDTGELVATPVTESVQVRVRLVGVRGGQSFTEFALRRSDLFAGKAGGLQLVPADAPAYLALQFVTGPEDPFEPSAEERVSHLMPVLETCRACHTEPGIHSVHSFTRAFTGRHSPQVDLALWPSSVQDEQKKVLEWKRSQYDWGLFQGLSAR